MRTSLILATLWKGLLNRVKGVEEGVEEAGAVEEEEQVQDFPAPPMALTPEAKGSLNAIVAVIERASDQKRKGEAVALVTGDL